MVVEPPESPADFRAAVDALRSAHVDPAVVVREVAAPARLAPYSFALAAEVLHGDDELSSGRFIVLHDPDGQPAWDGTTRVVSFLTADVDMEMAEDPLLPDVGWAWLLDSLDARRASHRAVGGTVTRTTSVRYGSLATDPPTCAIELRCSWTPSALNLDVHLAAFCDVLCSMAGLPPAQPGVARLPLARGSSV